MKMHSKASPLPRGPVLDWSNFKVIDTPGIASVEDLSHTVLTTSGRAAIYQALLQLKLPLASGVLVPSYHCPTMVAPVVLANLKPVFFGITTEGLPNLEAISPTVANQCKAMIVTHYFGLAKSLAEVRQWCDSHRIALIEDCAHCYFGEAGERPIGAWGDFATASISKFLPVAEGGVLASAHRKISPLQLSSQSIKAQMKGALDPIETAARYGRFFGINSMLNFIFSLKGSKNKVPATQISTIKLSPATMMENCDMGRIALAPLWASRLLAAILPRGRIVSLRQRNFATYAKHLTNVGGARPLVPLSLTSPSHIAPYVFPLWVDDADRVYYGLRAQELPVFRWDRVWSSIPAIDGDTGPLWSQHVLQLLCHQDLSEHDVERTSKAILDLLSNIPPQAPVTKT